MKKLRTKILCTIGPSSRSERVLRGLIREGIDGLRINLSHTNLEESLAIIKTVRKISRTIPIIIDSQGKETRLRGLEKPTVLAVRKQVRIIPEDAASEQHAGLAISRTEVFKVLREGDSIFVDDNSIHLRIEKIHRSPLVIDCVVLKAGTLGAPKNIRIARAIELKDPLTPRDKEVVKKLKPYGIHGFALSYVGSANDMKRTRKLVGGQLPLMAKIETPTAIKNLDEIIKASDSILIDRNDLGTEIGYEKIPLVQKFVIAKSKAIGKPIFVATHLLETMIAKEKPTRGEVNDVINTVLDGVTGLVLSSETAVGKDPVKIVKTLKKLVAQAEFVLDRQASGNIHSVIERLKDLRYI